MFAFLKRPGFMLLGGAALLAVVAFGSACGDDDDDSANATDGVTLEQFQKTSVLAALTTVWSEALHDIDDGAQTASEFDVEWTGRVERIRTAIAGTSWPDHMKERADATAVALATSLEDIEKEDLQAFKGDITAAHEEFHELNEYGQAFIAGEEPADDGDNGEEEASETATATQ